MALDGALPGIDIFYLRNRRLAWYRCVRHARSPRLPPRQIAKNDWTHAVLDPTVSSVAL